MSEVSGVLEKRGRWKRWSPISLKLQGNQLTELDLNTKKVKELMMVEGIIGTDAKGPELSFTVFYRSVSAKGDHSKSSLLLRAKDQGDYDMWIEGLRAATSKEKEGKVVANEEYDYGLPDHDPRNDLPLTRVDEHYREAFASLQHAVLHWFGVVLMLDERFQTVERVAVLGDRCLYLCSPEANILRCIQIVDIKKLVVAQDAKKDLYIIIVMPPRMVHQDGRTEFNEYDLMIHSPNIKELVRYMRTIFMHQKDMQMLPLEQLRDKEQLINEIRLAEPDEWKLNFIPPMRKDHFAKVLEQWRNSHEPEEHANFKKKVAQMLNAGDMGQPLMAHPSPSEVAPPASNTPEPPPAPRQSDRVRPQVVEEEEEEEEEEEDDEGGTVLTAGALDDPLGRLLHGNGLGQYYGVLKGNGMTIDTLTSGLIDDMDLLHFGVAKKRHRQKLLDVLSDESKIDEARKPRAPQHHDPADFSMGDLGTLNDIGSSSPVDDESKARAALEKEESDSREDLVAARSAFAPEDVYCDVTKPLGRFLKAIKLPQYYGFLEQRNIGMETLTCGLIDDQSLLLFGIENPGHRKKILEGIHDPLLVGDSSLDDFFTLKKDPRKELQSMEHSSRESLRSAEEAGRMQLLADFTDRMPAPAEIDTSDPLARFLLAIGLEQYYWGLASKDLSLEVMTCSLFGDDDLQNHCEIYNPVHRKKLRAALNDTALVHRAKEGTAEPGSWSVASAAREQMLQSAERVKEIGGLDLSGLGDDFLLGPAKPSAKKTGAAPPAKKTDTAPPPKPAAKKANLDLDLDLDLLGPPPAGSGKGKTSPKVNGLDLDLDLGPPPAKGSAQKVDIDLDDLDLLGPPPPSGKTLDISDL